ncbi:TonB-dependent receptor [Novosphingobium sp. 1949]|uniref:TonB-dependent receptor n=1 Tax=Novosphingobium organovorum TaxID=2930092 RepID=A0ABT0BD79_9SPHN|nr:TonB-dependent receptor [Novosphingobium organovorum]MCJ2183025.1 TonB-dependent receptor [Novosphingobium organovorum]
MSRRKSPLLPSALALGAALVSAPAWGQAAAEPSAPQPGEIVVTATKRSENIQSVPISISAIGGDALAKGRMDSVDSLVTKVANLQLSSIVGDNTPIFALRGVSMSDYSLNQASPVATYYDEVYKGNFAFLGVAMYDLERVEVLRGPQGTLYGKNTTGGAVNIISRTAKLGETSGYANLGFGNYDRVDLNGAINLPLGDKAALRVAGTYSKANGWFHNVVEGVPDPGGVREYGVRATLRYEPSSSVRFVAQGSTSYQDPTNYGIYAQPTADNRAGLGKWEIASDVTERRRARTYSLALHTDIDLSDTLTLTSITAWDKGYLHFREDSDGQASQLIEIDYDDKASQFAEDLRLTSDTGGPFDFIAGLYFNREKVFNSSTMHLATDTDVNADGTIDYTDCVDSELSLACQFRNRFDQIKKSLAAYTDLSYKLGGHVTLHGGLRYTHDTGRQYDFTSDALGVDEVEVLNLIPSSSLRFSTDNLSGKLGADYRFDGGTLLYASVSLSYRAPSFNAQAFFDASELSIAKAEKVTSYEVGAKTQLLGRAVTLNTAAFYYDYRNQQFVNVDPSTAVQTLLNVPKSRIYGAEADLTAIAASWLNIHGGIGLLATKILSGTVSGTNVAGNQLANAPHFTGNLGIDITAFDGPSGTLSFHPEVAYQAGQYFEMVNVARLRQGGYALLSGHIDYESADGLWNLSAWIKNATKKQYFTSRIDLMDGFGLDYNHVGTPRTYGITAGLKF